MTSDPNPKEQPQDFIPLVAQAKNGDEAAFEALYTQYFEPLHRYILIRVGDAEDADDLTQQVFIKFYRNLGNWQDKGYQPSAYLYTIARSVIADFYRSRGRKPAKLQNSEEVLLLLRDPSQTPLGNVTDAEEIRKLYTDLKQLPDNYQEALLLRYMENLSSADVAQIIGKSDVATRKLLSRAVAALAKVANSSKENEIS